MQENEADLNEKTRVLVHGAQKGKHEAIAALYNLYKNRLESEVHKSLGTKLRNQMETVDLIQSVWTDALEDLEGFNYQGHESFFRWLKACLIHKIQGKGRYFLAGKRDLKKVRPLQDDSSESGADAMPSATDPTPSLQAANRGQLDRIMSVLGRFPEVQQQILMLRLRDQMGYKEIGDRIGKSMEATRKLCGRTLAKLKTYLDEEGKD
ncbi:MAG: sigma-70 family RNA polymerase sigma factor [Planctomycetota bacterium]